MKAAMRMGVFLLAAADLDHAAAVPTAREWLAKERAANMKAVSIGVLGRHGGPADRALIEPYLTNPDPRLNGAARAALKRSGVQVSTRH